MKKKNKFLTKLEKQFNITIYNFQYFTGSSYKSGFTMIYNKENDNTNYTGNIVVKTNETYQEAIQIFFAKNNKVISNVEEYLSL